MDKKIKFAIKKRKQTRQLNCDAKKRYQNPSMAIASVLTYEDGGCEDILYYYKCDLCHGYHITKSGGGSSIKI